MTELSLEDQKSWWNQAARDNVKRAILSDGADRDLPEFFATGVHWRDQHRAFAEQAFAFTGRAGLTARRALDFGCGLGRMTLAWSELYTEVIGVDISEEMIKLANQNIAKQGIEFIVCDRYPLPFPSQSFDLIYSTIVIQHISYPHNLRYLKEFFRLVGRGGYVLFDAPAERLPSVYEGDGIFILPFDEVVQTASQHRVVLLALRSFGGTATLHYQYLFGRSR